MPIILFDSYYDDEHVQGIFTTTASFSLKIQPIFTLRQLLESTWALVFHCILINRIKVYLGANAESSILLVVSSPDCHALWAKDGLEQLLQILGPSVKRLFHSQNDVHYNERLF